MKYITVKQLMREDAEQEQKYLDEIGFFGRIIDGHVSYLLFLGLVTSIGFLFGLGIGLML